MAAAAAAAATAAVAQLDEAQRRAEAEAEPNRAATNLRVGASKKKMRVSSANPDGSDNASSDDATT